MSAKEYWVIDTESQGESLGSFSATGPYTSKRAAETTILDAARSFWDDACTCLKRDNEIAWSKPLHIVEVVRTVVPKITAKIALADVEREEA